MSIQVIENVNILNTTAQAVINPVNCVGTMGKGLARQFAYEFGSILTQPYEAACAVGWLRPGRVLCVDVSQAMMSPRYVINFPTKDDWRESSRLSYVTNGLNALSDEMERLGISSVAIPALGCGEGRLKWNDVRSEIERALAPLAIAVELYAPLMPGVEPQPVKLAGGHFQVNARKRPYPVSWLYCGRNYDGTVAAVGQHGWLGSPVIVGEVCSQPNCGKLHETPASTLPCYRNYLRGCLNIDRQFRRQFIADLSRHTYLACFCRTRYCHTSVIAEMFSAWRMKVEGRRTQSQMAMPISIAQI